MTDAATRKKKPPKRKGPRSFYHRPEKVRVQHRQQIAEMRLRCMRLADIARALQISESTVDRELKVLEKQWREEASQDIALAKAKEILKLDRLEDEAWRAWDRSRRSTRKVVQEAEGGIRKERTSNTGDPRYLQAVLSIQDRRNRLLGLDAPLKVAPTTPDGEALDLRQHDGAGYNLSALSIAELRQLRDLQRKARVSDGRDEPRSAE